MFQLITPETHFSFHKTPLFGHGTSKTTFNTDQPLGKTGLGKIRGKQVKLGFTRACRGKKELGKIV